MTAATIGQLVGFTLACAGIAYIWLAITWATRAYKRWPRQSVWSAALIAGLVGISTAFASPDDMVVYLLGTAIAVSFVLHRGAKAWQKRSVAT